MTHTESTSKIRSTYTYTYRNIHTRIQNSPHTCTHMTLKLRVGLAGRASVNSPLRCAGVPQICDNSQLHLLSRLLSPVVGWRRRQSAATEK